MQPIYYLAKADVFVDVFKDRVYLSVEEIINEKKHATILHLLQSLGDPQDSPGIARGGPSSPAWPSDQSRDPSPNASGGLTHFSPPSEPQEIPVATREQSGLLCFHSR